jgi:hypothetical protein
MFHWERLVIKCRKYEVLPYIIVTHVSRPDRSHQFPNRPLKVHEWIPRAQIITSSLCHSSGSLRTKSSTTVDVGQLSHFHLVQAMQAPLRAVQISPRNARQMRDFISSHTRPQTMNFVCSIIDFRVAKISDEFTRRFKNNNRIHLRKIFHLLPFINHFENVL